MDFSIPNNAKVYLNKPYVKLFWNSKNGILTSKWTGFCSGDEIQAVGARILDAVNFEGVQKVLYDAKDIEVLDEQSQNYIAGRFTRQMIQAGVKFSATVFPDDVFAKFAIDDIQQSISGKRESNVSYFNSFNKAFDWLSTK